MFRPPAKTSYHSPAILRRKRRLILHLGFNKTGSSALQSWLANNVSGLSDQGFFYEIGHKENLNYRVGPGNGERLRLLLRSAIKNYPKWRIDRRVHQKIRKRRVDLHYLDNDHPNIIISSEGLPLARRSIPLLKEIERDFDVRINIVAFMRDPIDHLFSLYAHEMKLRGDAKPKPFEAYLDGPDIPHHIALATLLAEHFKDIKLLSYDNAKKNVAAAFCDAAGLDYSKLEPMRKVSVNRALLHDEMQVVRQVHEWSERYAAARTGRPPGPGGFNTLSGAAAIYLVNQYPERKGKKIIPTSHATLRALEAKYGPAIERFNADLGARFGFSLRSSYKGDFEICERADTMPLSQDILRDVAIHLSGETGRLGDDWLDDFAEFAAAVDIETSTIFKKAARSRLGGRQ